MWRKNCPKNTKKRKKQFVINIKHILFIFCIVRQHNKLNVCYIALCNWMAICIALQEGVLQNEICLIKVPLSETTRKLNTQANNQS